MQDEQSNTHNKFVFNLTLHTAYIPPKFRTIFALHEGHDKLDLECRREQQAGQRLKDAVCKLGPSLTLIF